MTTDVGTRTVTSAVPTMSVSAVRRALSHIRKCWDSQRVLGAPLYISDPLPGDVCGSSPLSIQSFSFRFVCGHHEKRCRKRDKDAARVSKEETTAPPLCQAATRA